MQLIIKRLIKKYFIREEQNKKLHKNSQLTKSLSAITFSFPTQRAVFFYKFIIRFYYNMLINLQLTDRPWFDIKFTDDR